MVRPAHRLIVLNIRYLKIPPMVDVVQTGHEILCGSRVHGATLTHDLCMSSQCGEDLCIVTCI